MEPYFPKKGCQHARDTAKHKRQLELRPKSPYESQTLKGQYRNWQEDLIKRVQPEWSTFDEFKVFDCSSPKDKWSFFTGQQCQKPSCLLNVGCQGADCNCCEEIRCLDDLSRPFFDDLQTSKLTLISNYSDGIVIENCTQPKIGHQNCRGFCSNVDPYAAARFIHFSTKRYSSQTVNCCCELSHSRDVIKSRTMQK